MARTARKVVQGYPHHVVQRGNNRQKIFLNKEDYQIYLNLLINFSHREGSEIRSFCLMSNHVHLLLIPSMEYSMAKTMHRLNTTYSTYFNLKYSRSGSIWEGRYYSSIVDSDSYLWIVTKYIERNPVRAGLVNHPLEYKWSSASTSIKQRENYILFLEQSESEADLEIIRKGTLRNRYIGGETFESHLKLKMGIEFPHSKRGRPLNK